MAESTGKAQADEHDSGASIMGRGGQHGDTVAFGKLLRTVDSWSTRHEPMQASEIESEHEGGEEAWEDDEDDAEDKEGSRARCAPAQSQSAAKEGCGSAQSAADGSAPSAEGRLQPCQYGPNTPVKTVKRKGGVQSAVWKVVMRINSCANLVVTEGSSLLSTDEIDMLVVLRMNKVFIGFMRQNYPEVIESVHAKYGSVIRVEDCVEEEYEDEQPASIDME